MNPRNVPKNFFNFVNKTTKCWVWSGHLNESGYGSFRIHPRRLLAHRYSWILHNGKIPKGLGVLHKCDNPSCVRPFHLFLGTPSDNALDAKKKMRTCIGEKNGRAKLTVKQIKWIRANYRHGKGITMAKKFNVTPTAISAIITGKNWVRI